MTLSWAVLILPLGQNMERSVTVPWCKDLLLYSGCERKRLHPLRDAGSQGSRIEGEIETVMA